jgi:hypothetical protein
LRIIEFIQKKKIELIEFESPGEILKGRFLRAEEISLFEPTKTNRLYFLENEEEKEYAVLGSPGIDEFMTSYDVIKSELLGKTISIEFLGRGITPSDRNGRKFDVLVF